MSTNFLLRPSAKMILREATNCCHFYSATRCLRAAELSTGRRSAVYTVRAHIMTGTLTPTCTARFAKHSPNTLPLLCNWKLLFYNFSFRKMLYAGDFFNTRGSAFFSFASLPSRTPQSTPVDSVTLKINKVIRRFALPHPPRSIQ